MSHTIRCNFRMGNFLFLFPFKTHLTKLAIEIKSILLNENYILSGLDIHILHVLNEF